MPEEKTLKIYSAAVQTLQLTHKFTIGEFSRSQE